jgi:ribosomal protein L12E/L44/L45/RPP1/RPP2
MYRNIKDYLTESETTQEAVGEPAAPLYDLIDEVGSHQLVLDELVRFLDVDQIEEFVADFRRHHDMQEAHIGAPDYNPAAGKWEHNMDDEDEDEDEEDNEDKKDESIDLLKKLAGL